ncbi:hypothetical protein OAG54_00830 [Flavobacteriales bacterium]|nr:hypothetical protein [Flavobacteriales bacterium]
MLSEKEKEKAKKDLQAAGLLAVLTVLGHWIRVKWKNAHISDKYAISGIFSIAILANAVEDIFGDFGKVTQQNKWYLISFCLLFFVPYFYLRHFSPKHKIKK